MLAYITIFLLNTSE